MPAPTILSIKACPERLLEVIELGKANSKTLGFMPQGGFEEFAEKDRILLAIDDSDSLLGYLLFRITGGEAKIVHLCVNPSVRRSGISSSLIARLRSDLSHLDAISLMCRRDYVEASRLWTKLNFIPVEERLGRAKSGSELTRWRLNLGQPDLFPFSPDLNTIIVTVDSCVFFSHYDEMDSRHADANALWADWLADDVTIRVTSEILIDNERSPDAGVRAKTRERAFDYMDDSSESGFEINETRLRNLWPQDKQLGLSDESDIRHLAKAIAYQSDVFVTSDDALLKLGAVVEKEFPIRVLDPVQFIIELDEIKRASEYQPVRLAGSSNFEIRRPLKAEIALLSETFLDNPKGEKRSDYDAVIRSLLHDFENSDIRVVLNDELGLIAVVGYFVGNDSLDVRTIRAVKHSLNPTLLRYLISWCTRKALAQGVSCVQLTEISNTAELLGAAEELGFILVDDCPTKIILRACKDPNEVCRLLSEIRARTPALESHIINLEHSIAGAVDNENAQILASVEHRLWPAKLLLDAIPTFLIPIRPLWAMHLFDTQLAEGDFFGNREQIAMRPENVYYRSPLNNGGLRAPARILWYVSQGKNREGPAEVRACSRLVAVDVGTPKILYRRYKHLGVYSWKNLKEVTSEGEVMALRFDDTELLPKSLDLKSLRELFLRHNRPLFLQSPTELPINIFEEIYRGAFADA